LELIQHLMECSGSQNVLAKLTMDGGNNLGPAMKTAGD
jgi:hypothetical protein